MKNKIHFIKTVLFHYAKPIRYILIGGCTTVVSFFIYWVLYDLFKIDPTLANTISIICAVIFAYITNKLFVFKSKCSTSQELLSEIFGFFSARMVTMFLEIGGVFFLYTYIKITPMISKIVVSLVVLVLNYLLSQFFVFKRSE